MASNGSKVGFWVVIAVLVMLLFGSFITNVGLVTALFAGASAGQENYPVDEEPSFEEVWSQGYGDTKVVRIGLTGVIMRGQPDRLFGAGPDMVVSILGQIKAATIDPAVKAILLDVDSPGGSVTPSDEIYEALQEFKRQDEERMIVVFIRGIGASGAYYAAMAGDYIIAEPTAIVGSVGVIMQTMNMKGLGDKLGLTSVTIASGENKDMLNPLEEVDPAHLAMLQDLVDRMQNRFASIVEQSRGFDSRDLLDGRVFMADQALELDFIDAVGYWDDAIAELSLLLDDELYMIRYNEKMTFFEALMTARMPKMPSMQSIQSPRFLYMWHP